MQTPKLMFKKSYLLPLVLLDILLIFLLIYQRGAETQKFDEMVMMLIGTAIVTFLGVYLSFRLTASEERKREDERKEKNYTNGLKLIYSELTINEEAIDILSRALKAMPDAPGLFYENYTFLMEMSKGVRTKNFDNLIGSDSMNEIISNDEVINCIQQAYYNIEKAVSGLALSREVFIMLKDKNPQNIPLEMIQNAKNIISKEAGKTDSTLELIKKAEKRLLDELTLRKVTFTLDPQQA